MPVAVGISRFASTCTRADLRLHPFPRAPRTKNLTNKDTLVGLKIEGNLNEETHDKYMEGSVYFRYRTTKHAPLAWLQLSNQIVSCLNLVGPTSLQGTSQRGWTPASVTFRRNTSGPTIGTVTLPYVATVGCRTPHPCDRGPGPVDHEGW